jgi:hypothetical protein
MSSAGSLIERFVAIAVSCAVLVSQAAGGSTSPDGTARPTTKVTAQVGRGSPAPSLAPSGAPVSARVGSGRVGRATDVLVYGGTPGGILAAVAASRAGSKVVLLEPTGHVGGMVTNGLNWTDYGQAWTIGGFTREFFDRVEAVEGDSYGRYHFQSSTAERVLEQMLLDAGVTVVREARLVESGGVRKNASRIEGVTTMTAGSFEARVFVDASYEGDLMAMAGVSYRVGRESQAEYGESRAGVRPARRILPLPPDVTFEFVSPPPGPVGSGDGRIQNSNYRICFSTDPDNQVPFPRPDGYDRGAYEVVPAYFDYLQASQPSVPVRLTSVIWPNPLTRDEFDVNEYGALSLGLPGANWNYPEGSYAERGQIERLHEQWDKGLLYFLRHDPAVPASIQSEIAVYGLCSDEFTDNGHWPRQLYLREGRRMVGVHVLTEHDVDGDPEKSDSIGVASYPRDAHDVSRWIENDELLVEGGFWTLVPLGWEIPYRSLTPQPAEATNLIVPVAASASHVAFASLRMEPQYMIMGEAAGQAAAMAAAGRTNVQDVPVAALQAALKSRGAVLQRPFTVPVSPPRTGG